MINYFFISSPLHFFIATNLAISHKNDTNIAIFISKNEKTAQQYAKASRKYKNIYQQTYDLTINHDQPKYTQRKRCFSQIKDLVSSKLPNRIFTGSDRRIEFQFAMFQARKLNACVEGIYIDDGIVSYLGHKSIDSLFHKYIDPTLKKLVYGFWWKNALTIGSSSWITKAYLAAPKDAISLLQTKELIQLDQNIFTCEQFLEVNNFLIEKFDELENINFNSFKAVICLPYESFYLKNPNMLQQIKRTIEKRFPLNELAIKAHPRSKEMALLENIFTGSISLPNTLGMELLLPKLPNNISIIGDVSTALLTAKWLKPKVNVLAFEVHNETSTQLKNLFHGVGITFLPLEAV